MGGVVRAHRIRSYAGRRRAHTRRRPDRGAYDQLTEGYDHEAIEARWKIKWAERWPNGCQSKSAADNGAAEERTKKYVLSFFPYPSGEGLSVGHLRNYIAGDVVARVYRMRGYDVLHPMGWDAFGLPAENEARLHGRHPVVTTRAYAANYRRQLDLVSVSYDWSRELFSTDPHYYRWTQWLFLLLLRRGLAYRGSSEQWWCETCSTVLANEQVVEPDARARCWRCNCSVVRRKVDQWFLRITAYADRLLDDLEGLDWPDGIVTMQRNWIGRCVEDGRTGFRLRDWAVGRQRFWGAPIPVVHCEHCGVVPVPDADLPVRLPDVDKIPEPTAGARGRPASPLAALPDFVRTTCPSCGAAARRETDTMDGFACSSWYFLRFISPHEGDRPFDPSKAERWMPVDLYVGGAEQAVMHLLYARFVTKVLHDAGYVSVSEPFRALRNQGMILDATGQKMSKSRPEYVVTPDESVASHGADALRVYEMFIAPFDQDVSWDPDGISGASRWLRRVWRIALRGHGPSSERGDAAATARSADEAARAGWERRLRAQTHRTSRDVSRAMDRLGFNVAVARLMAFTNTIAEAQDHTPDDAPVWAEAVDVLLRLMAPFAPHIAEELWWRRGCDGSIHESAWPSWDDVVAADEWASIVVQVDGVMRGRLRLPAGADEATARSSAVAEPSVAQHLSGRIVARVVFVPDRVVNFVTRGEAP